VCASAFPEPIRVWVGVALGCRFHREQEQGLHRAVPHGRYPQWALPSIAFGYPDAPQRLGPIPMQCQSTHCFPFLTRRIPEFAVDATRPLPLVFGHFPDGQCLGLPGSDEISLKSFDPSEILFQFRLRDSRLRFSYECLNSLPVNGMPLAVFVTERSIEDCLDVFHTFSGSVKTRRRHPSPRARMPSGVGLKDAHGSRRHTCCKSAGFHLGA